MNVVSTWPPATLTIKTDELIDDCELMEIYPERGAGKALLPVVELAALLYVGQYVHARHVWRRWKTAQNIDNIADSASGATGESSLLADWWKVGVAMMESSDPSTIWSSLAHIQQNHPSPLNTYAREVGDMYRERIITKFGGGRQQPPKQPYWSLLNFANLAEYEQFCHIWETRNGNGYNNGGKFTSSSTPSADENPSLTQVVAFLESSPWNVES